MPTSKPKLKPKPIIGPFAYCRGDKVRLKKSGQKLVDDFLAQYPRPELILAGMRKNRYSTAARYLFRKWSANVEMLEQMQSAALHGIVRAATRFRPDTEASFPTYAAFYVFQSVQEIDKQYNRTNRISTVSLDSNYADDNDGFCLNIVTGGEDNPHRDFENKDVVRRVMNKLPNRLRSVLHQRYLADGKTRTLREVSDEMGVCKERIRQLTDKASVLARKRVANPFPGD